MEYGDWKFAASNEVRRSFTLFSVGLFVIAVEMVLAHSRGCAEGVCQVLVMWCLKTPLHEFLFFLDAMVAHACWHIHNVWGLEQPQQGYELVYSLTAWMQSGRFQFKSGQNAHGSNVEVSLWFLVRRQEADQGLRGEQTYSAYVFEQSTRATLRQHVFLEDLRAEEVVPNWDPFWSDAWALGLREREQYSASASESVGKRTLQSLRVLQYLEESLSRCHGLPPQEVSQYRFTPTNQDVLPIFLRSTLCQELFASESLAAKRLLNRPDLNRMQVFFAECKKCYWAMSWRDEEVPIIDAATLVLQGVPANDAERTTPWNAIEQTRLR
jgi:hypothetical protein